MIDKIFIVKFHNAAGEIVKESRIGASGPGQMLRYIDETYHVDMMFMIQGICQISWDELEQERIV